MATADVRQTSLGRVGLQIIRDWVLRLNSHGPDGLIDRKAPGAVPKLNAAWRQALAEKVAGGPTLGVDGVVRWRLKDLAHWISEEFGISIDETTVGREPKATGSASCQPGPVTMPRMSKRLKTLKKFQTRLAEIDAALPPGTGIELWWQDKARIGQKNKITRRWARQGTCPVEPQDQRASSAYIFGGGCPERGAGAVVILPRCDTRGMQWHLDEIANQVAPGAHAVLMMDRAGWHMTDKLIVPANITIIALPPRSPELNPVENVWKFMREN